MLIVTNRFFMLIVVKLNVVNPSVVMLNVVAPLIPLNVLNLSMKFRLYFPVIERITNYVLFH